MSNFYGIKVDLDELMHPETKKKKYMSLREDVRQIIEKYSVECDSIEDFEITDQSNKKRESYVYEWSTIDEKVFYVGKGVKDRINHIIWDELKNDADDGIYNYLNKIGIKSRKIVEGLTDLEACIYEVYWIWKREQEGNVLLQFKDSNSYWKDYDVFNKNNQNKIKPDIYITPVHKKYYGINDGDLVFDDFDLESTKSVLIDFKDYNNSKKFRHYLESLRIRVYQKDSKYVDTVFFDYVIDSYTFKKYKSLCHKLIHFNQIKDKVINNLDFCIEDKSSSSLIYNLSFLDSFGPVIYYDTYEECYSVLTESEKEKLQKVQDKIRREKSSTYLFKNGIKQKFDESIQFLFDSIDGTNDLLIKAKFDGFKSKMIGVDQNSYIDIAYAFHKEHNYQEAFKYYAISLLLELKGKKQIYSYWLIPMIGTMDKLHLYSEIVELCKFAISNNISDQFTANGYEGRLKKYQNKLNECIIKENKKVTKEKKTNNDKIENNSRGKKIVQLDDAGNIINIFDSISIACEALNTNSKSIRDAISGKQKHAAGYVWKKYE